MIQVLVNDKPIMSPAGHPLDVPTEALAKAIADEWGGDIKAQKKGYEGRLLTSLAATAIDRTPDAREAIINQLIEICQNDQLLCWSDQSQELIGKQEEQWGKLIVFINQELGINLKHRFDFHIHPLPPEAMDKLTEWLNGLDVYGLSAFSYMADLTRSFIVPFALIQDQIASAEDAWEVAELQELHQQSQWGEDEEAVERTRKLKEEFCKTYAFFHLSEI